MLNTPVLFLIFNRPDLAEYVFAAIREAKPTKLFVAADGPRKNKAGEEELCKQTRNTVLEHIDWPCDVKTLLRDTNLGCKVAVSSAIGWFFEYVEEGIILEDDIYPDHSFFTFCEEMLVKYSDDKRVTQVSGVNLMTQLNNSESYFFSKVGGIWGWATWRRVWQYYDVNISSWHDKKVKIKIAKFLGKRDWFNVIKDKFDMVYYKHYDTWDFQFVFMQLKIEGLAIIPSENLVKNIGFRNDATHTRNSNELIESKLKVSSLHFPLQHPDKVISNELYEAFYFSLVDRAESFRKRVSKILKAKIEKWVLKL